MLQLISFAIRDRLRMFIECMTAVCRRPPSAAARTAAADALEATPRAAGGAVLAHRVEHVLTARRLEPAVAAEEPGGAARPEQQEAVRRRTAVGQHLPRVALAACRLRQRPAARLGGTVPVYEMLQRELGAYAIAFGWGSNDEGQHAPNEFFRLKSFELGQRGYCILLEKLAEMLS